MKQKILLTTVLVLLIPGHSFAYKILYVEQFYKLYHRHFYYTAPDDVMENIVWLEQALNADFCNPLYALAKIESKEQWKHYQYLLTMHINLKLVELYLMLGAGYDKQVAYFYNAPWKKQNFESLKTAEWAYTSALYYWGQAINWAKKLIGSPYHLDDQSFWEDERYRMVTGELDYRDIIGEHLNHLYQVRKNFEAMDEKTY